MAFLDNSGDIILDAVLTEAGRRKLSRGQALEINAFALGDDEINYGTYNIDHPSGDAYYDLELLQTPVLESITGRAAGINHGLLKMPDRSNLLYLPELMVNTKNLTAFGITPAAPVDNNFRPYRGAFYIFVTPDTFVEFDRAAAASEVPADFKLRDHSYNAPTVGPVSTTILLESGLNTTEVTKDITSRNDFVVSNGLRNQQYLVDVDRRLFSSMAIPKMAGYGPMLRCRYSSSDGKFIFEADLMNGVLGRVPEGTSKGELFNYIRTGVPTVNSAANLELFEADSTVTAPAVSTYSMFAGPTADICGFVPLPNVSVLGTSTVNRLWTDLGKLVTGAQLMPGATSTFASNTFYFIDTFVYVTGANTGASTQFTVRLVRKA
jgi:hypothetical protein